MPRARRSEVFDPSEVAIVHTVQRCVRRAFLAGQDSFSGRDYRPRREWIRRRLELLASVFGIDVLTYAILSNHMHLMLRSRPDVVATWSDQEVAGRWLRLFPGRLLDEHLGQPAATDIDALARDGQRMQVIRLRLSDISWFMRAASEPIARRANREDECTGRFWEGRYKAQRITDEAGLLACAMYVDLNPVRAALAATPEQCEHTSARDRIGALRGETVASAAGQLVPVAREQASQEAKSLSVGQRRRRTAARQRAGTESRIPRDAWLSRLTLDEHRGKAGPQASRSGVRASDKGFLSMPLSDYLELLKWTGRQGRRHRRGKIPSSLEPVLARLGINGSMWCELVWNFKRHFGRSAGRPASLAADAARVERRWTRGQRAAAEFFISA